MNPVPTADPDPSHGYGLALFFPDLKDCIVVNPPTSIHLSWQNNRVHIRCIFYSQNEEQFLFIRDYDGGGGMFPHTAI